MKNTLKERLLPHYQELLTKVAEISNLRTFCIQWGEEYSQKEGILFVGKATNGWITSSKDIDILFGEGAQRIFSRDDQMKWVADLEGNQKVYHENKEAYNTRKSAFWRLIKDVAQTHFVGGKWYSKIAWSNLYKVAPEKGNPNANLRKIQIEHCKKILKTEIETLQPKYVVFLTSGWENIFANGVFTNAEVTKTESVQWGKGNKYLTKGNNIGEVTYIFSPHPQGKNEDEHKNAIIKLIELLNK